MSLKVIYWSGTGNTKMMAEAIAEGAKASDDNVELLPVDQASIDDVKEASKLALGCPAMGNEELEESEFRPFIDEIKAHLAGKTLLLFGSYEWFDGQWMEDWLEEMEATDANNIIDGYACYGEPDDEAKEECRRLGKELARS